MQMQSTSSLEDVDQFVYPIETGHQQPPVGQYSEVSKEAKLHRPTTHSHTHTHIQTHKLLQTPKEQKQGKVLLTITKVRARGTKKGCSKERKATMSVSSNFGVCNTPARQRGPGIRNQLLIV